MKKALILLGCPEAPSQTPMALYSTYKLTKIGYEVTIASTPSAMKLLEVSDPEGFYVKKKIDIESCLEDLEEGSFDLLLGFVHKDAAVSYFVTFYHILNTASMALVFEKDSEILEKMEKDLKESTDATVISARAYHNPTPLRVKFDRAIKGLED
ncbi:MAG TPA: DUF1890 domain-containing protein [Methanobacterium sp.]